jgi:hypothetical protein
MPYRRAVAEIWRGACRLSSTILYQVLEIVTLGRFP